MTILSVSTAARAYNTLRPIETDTELWIPPSKNEKIVFPLLENKHLVKGDCILTTNENIFPQFLLKQILVSLYLLLLSVFFSYCLKALLHKRVMRYFQVFYDNGTLMG